MNECDCWVISKLRDHGISLFDEMKYFLCIAASKHPPKQTDSDSPHYHPNPPRFRPPRRNSKAPRFDFRRFFILTAGMTGSVDVLARE